jgi:hypothetical protein
MNREIDRIMGNTPSDNNNNNGDGGDNGSKPSAGSAQAFFSAEKFATYAKETEDEKTSQMADFFAGFATWASKG